MFDTVGWERSFTIDEREQQLLAGEREIARIRGEQMRILEELDRFLRRTTDRSDLRDALDSGASFDRVEALSRIDQAVGSARAPRRARRAP